jgi:hypothetical protein
MQLLFKGQKNDFSDECQRAALDAAVLETITNLRSQRVKNGLAAMKDEQLAVSLYESAIQWANEREAQAQAEYQARQDYAAEALREILLNPACDVAAHAEKLDRMQKTIDILRGSVSYGRQIEVPNRLVELTEKQSVLADAHADESYLAAVEAGAESIKASMLLVELEGVAMFMVEGSRTAQLYDAARESYKVAVACKQAVHDARKRAEMLAQGGVR